MPHFVGEGETVTVAVTLVGVSVHVDLLEVACREALRLDHPAQGTGTMSMPNLNSTIRPTGTEMVPSGWCWARNSSAFPRMSS